VSDLEDFGMGCAGLILVLLLVGMLGLMAGAALDSVVFERRAFAKTTACETTRGVPRRKLFSTEVICVPENARQDTTTINLQTP
jgi:hypothetical protein